MITKNFLYIFSVLSCVCIFTISAMYTPQQQILEAQRRQAARDQQSRIALQRQERERQETLNRMARVQAQHAEAVRKAEEARKQKQ